MLQHDVATLKLLLCISSLLQFNHQQRHQVLVHLHHLLPNQTTITVLLLKPNSPSPVHHIFTSPSLHQANPTSISPKSKPPPATARQPPTSFTSLNRRTQTVKQAKSTTTISSISDLPPTTEPQFTSVTPQFSTSGHQTADLQNQPTIAESTCDVSITEPNPLPSLNPTRTTTQFHHHRPALTEQKKEETDDREEKKKKLKLIRYCSYEEPMCSCERNHSAKSWKLFVNSSLDCYTSVVCEKKI